ncbi:MAG: amidohydrolase family protein [Alphaproteobacteria bacterium]|nr:amidohydrolase family protein [Alphaproteobacteria bacterium]MBU1512931.1 amidohydrolase family protein [Alphaproteobacteria bacterium]MBU2096628.1 amidohydrolase family protein [Alphaproteobacteria bacterium]MBU2150511.1 amidohydrolase family protein [Alphaproteobacteria bacterium]MBU2306560.1 amidohydrolase family protein [Alphaproteobacteria bacterium]
MIRRLASLLAATALVAATDAQAATVAIVNAHILNPGAAEIASGTVVIRDGKIVAVGASVATPAGAQVVDAKGGVLTPGFVAVNSMLGAVEISAVGDDVDVNTPDIGAAFDVQYALNPDSTVIPVARLGGITSAVVTPRAEGGQGGAGEHDDSGDEATSGAPASENAHHLFAGQAAVIQLGRGQEMLIKARVAMVSPFGDAGAKVAGGARGAEYVLLKEALADVRAYMRNRAAYERASYRDLSLSRADLEALIPVVQGEMPLIAVANRASDIRAVLKLAKEEKLKLILSGAAEAWRVAPELAAAGVPVILNPVLDRPTSLETLGSTMENAARLEAAGVTVAIEGNSGAHRAHEMRYNAGVAVANGMTKAGALAAISLNPAKIFGVSARVGSLEPGKDADLVIWSGDPFEPMSRPQLILVRGEAQPLRSRQLDLRDRYLDLNRPMPPGYSH